MTLPGKYDLWYIIQNGKKLDYTFFPEIADRHHLSRQIYRVISLCGAIELRQVYCRDTDLQPLLDVWNEACQGEFRYEVVDSI
jgi:hypothetical protein